MGIIPPSKESNAPTAIQREKFLMTGQGSPKQTKGLFWVRLPSFEGWRGRVLVTDYLIDADQNVPD